MLTNYVVDADLKQYHPNLNKQLWSQQSTYANQINEAFSIVLDDFHNMGVNPRLLQTPLLLNSETIATSTTGTGVKANDDETVDNNYRRIVFDVTAISGTWSVILDGATGDADYREVASMTADSVGVQSITFTPQYRWYRVRTVSGTTLSYSAKLVETIFDRCVVYKAFSIIFSDFRKSQGDSWDLLASSYDSKYDAAMKSIKYTLDSNEDGVIDDGEQGDNSYYLTL